MFKIIERQRKYIFNDEIYHFFFNKQLKTILTLLSTIYIVGLFWHIATLIYFTSSKHNIVATMINENWQYWTEELTVKDTIFLDFMHQLVPVNGDKLNLILFGVNFISLLCMVYILFKTIDNIVSTKTKNDLHISLYLKFITVLFLFSRLHEVNIFWYFSSLPFLGYLSAYLGLYLLIMYKMYEKIPTFVFSFIFICLSVLLLPYNLAILPIYLFLILFLQIRHFKLYLLFIAFLYACFLTMRWPDNFFSIVYDTSLIEEILNYIGGIFFDLTNKRESFTVSEGFGIFFVLSMLFFSFRIFRDKKTSLWYILILLWMYLYIAISIEATFVSRSANTHFLYTYTYMSVSLLSWTSLLILYTLYYRTYIYNGDFVYHVFITIVFVLSVFQYNYPNEYRYKMALLELTLKHPDLNKLRRLYPNIEYDSYWKPVDESYFLSKNLTNLMKDKKSIFSNHILYDIPDSLKQPLDIKVKVNKTVYVDRIRKVNSNFYELIGWSLDDNTLVSPAKLYILDENASIIGYALSGLERQDVVKVVGKKARYAGFTGYMYINDNTKKYYLIDENLIWKKSFILKK
jgi:hypothetical protein